MKWLRWHHGTVADPKWRAIARRSGQSIPTVIAVWAAMLETASEATERGNLEGWDDEVVAAALDLDTEAVAAIREAMQGLVLDGNALSGWERRQPKREDNTVAERVRKHREKKRREAQRNADVTRCNAGVTQGNAPEEDTERELTSTEDKSSEAGPHGLSAEPDAEGTEQPAAPPPPNSNDGDPGEAEELDLPAIRAQLAPAIREHLWLGNEVPHLVALSKPGWNMGRELNIATGFIERGEATVEEVIGAMKFARRVLFHSEVKPISMLAFNGKGRRDRLHEAIALWRRDQMKRRFDEYRTKAAIDEVVAMATGGVRESA